MIRALATQSVISKNSESCDQTAALMKSTLWKAIQGEPHRGVEDEVVDKAPINDEAKADNKRDVDKVSFYPRKNGRGSSNLGWEVDFDEQTKERYQNIWWTDSWKEYF